MSDRRNDYEAWQALVQVGRFIYPKKESEKVLFPTLSNCAWLKGRAQPNLWDEYNKKEYPEHVNLKHKEYSINKHGFRGKELSESPAEILAAGCSQTWGIGVPDPYIWPSILSEKTNMSIDNIGYSGKSIAGIVQLIFCYFREVGLPKYLFVAFPDPFRILSPTTNKFMHSKNPIGSDDEQDMMANTNLGHTRFLSEKPKYASAPYFLEEMFTEEMTVWQAVSYIQMLEDYCNAAGIFLRYGSWDHFSTGLLDAIANQNNFYKNYVSLDTENWVTINIRDKKQTYGPNPYCHVELKDEENSLFWDVANDFYWEDGRNAHLGVHRHIHIAEIFERELLNND